jgi:hypothetical protein
LLVCLNNNYIISWLISYRVKLTHKKCLPYAQLFFLFKFLSNFESFVSVKNSVSVISLLFRSNSTFRKSLLHVQLASTGPSPVILSFLLNSVRNNNNFSPVLPASPTLQNHNVWELPLFIRNAHKHQPIYDKALRVKIHILTFSHAFLLSLIVKLITLYATKILLNNISICRK